MRHAQLVVLNFLVSTFKKLKKIKLILIIYSTYQIQNITFQHINTIEILLFYHVFEINFISTCKHY